MKKKLVLCVCLLVVATSASASVCIEMAKVAKLIMEVRQSGASIVDQLEAVDKAKTETGMNDIYKAIVYDAYERPFFVSPEAKRLSANKFETDVYLMCKEKWED